ncbi:hypothetical protein [Azospirillum halopraeferens]|uniref:hypothetical protein n=1 Tax=Azospirillum halopraeferens TaxID=34010 RepID=UPI00041141BF|nr:hypothetical protein [Azospirillum halopraeferens]
MASIMIKVAREGLISKALKTADIGPTSGDSIIYEIRDVPEGKTVDDVIAAFRTYKPGDKEYEIDWAALAS